jgi:hypothetical protein
MEYEDSLPCSRDPYTGPCPPPDESNPYHPILSKTYFNIIDPPIWNYLEISLIYKSLEVDVAHFSAISWHSHSKKGTSLKFLIRIRYNPTSLEPIITQILV